MNFGWPSDESGVVVKISVFIFFLLHIFGFNSLFIWVFLWLHSLLLGVCKRFIWSILQSIDSNPTLNPLLGRRRALNSRPLVQIHLLKALDLLFLLFLWFFEFFFHIYFPSRVGLNLPVRKTVLCIWWWIISMERQLFVGLELHFFSKDLAKIGKTACAFHLF